MTDYKLVPVERCAACGNAKPVSEMETCMHNQMHRYVCDSKCMNDFYNPPKNLRHDAAAPDVQGEPVSLRERLFRGWEGCSNHGCVVVEPRPGMARTNGSCQCVVNASRSQLYMLQGRIQSVLNAAPQQSPDVTQLVEALEMAHMALIGYLPGHRNDITDAAISQCEQVLAPYRKGGDES